MRLAVELDGPVAAGGELRGRVNVVAGGEHRQLQVALRLCEHSRDYREEIDHAHAVLAPAGQLREGQSFAFALAVPPHAGPPIDTPWGGLAWEVRVWAEGAGGREPEVRRPLPTG